MSNDLTKNDELNQYARRFGVTLTAGMIELLSGGSLGGVLLGSAISSLRTDFSQRNLSDREKERIHKLIILGAVKFHANIELGKMPTNFSDDTAEEIVEALMVSSQHEHQQRKIKYFANLLGNISFHPEVDQRLANLLIRSASSLTYSQLVLLQLFSDSSIKSMLPDRDYRGKENIPWEIITYLHEIKELFDDGLLGMPGDAMLGLTDVNPGKINTQGQGKMLTVLMELEAIPQVELLQAVSLLSRDTV